VPAAGGLGPQRLHLQVERGSSAPRLRLRRTLANRRTGRTARPTIQTISSASAGSRNAKGAIVRSAKCAARCSRTFMGCATWMTRPRASTPNTRQRPLGVVAVDSPSVVSPGSTVWGRDRYTRTPSSVHTCTTKS